MPSALRSGGGSLLSSVPGGAIGEPLRAIYRVLPSGLTLMPRGRLPRGIVDTTRRVAVSITVRSPEFSLVTYRRPAGVVIAGSVLAGAAGDADCGGAGCEQDTSATLMTALIKTLHSALCTL